MSREHTHTHTRIKVQEAKSNVCIADYSGKLDKVTTFKLSSYLLAVATHHSTTCYTTTHLGRSLETPLTLIVVLVYALVQIEDTTRTLIVDDKVKVEDVDPDEVVVGFAEADDVLGPHL